MAETFQFSNLNLGTIQFPLIIFFVPTNGCKRMFLVLIFSQSYSVHKEEFDKPVLIAADGFTLLSWSTHEAITLADAYLCLYFSSHIIPENDERT